MESPCQTRVSNAGNVGKIGDFPSISR